MSAAAVNVLAQRLGALLQRRRRQLGLTQAELAERANLSLKYLGEVERGEANVTVDALGRIAVALAWDPWSLFASATPAISQSVHQLLFAEVSGARNRLQTVVDWLVAIDPALRVPVEITEDESLAAVAQPGRRGRPPKADEGGEP
jgi:transcriptional regulator with XRE-family HTH domain